MAVTLKRKRGAVSYREPSSDEGLSESSEQEYHMPPKRVEPSRRSGRHQQPSARRASPVTDRYQATASRSSRRHDARRVTYKDISTDDEEEGDDPDADFDVSDNEPPPRTKLHKTPDRSSKPQSLQPHKNKASSKGRSPRKFVLGAPLKAKETSQAAVTTTAIPTDGLKPAWATLPYHVLLQIFVYASHPLRDENMKPMASIAWLVEAARMCSAFTKPALTALYRNPPIFAMKQTRKDLVWHLISPPSEACQDHRVMVKRLELDATQMSAFTDHANSLADLVTMVRSLTTLREVDIFDPNDRPPFRERLRRLRRWVYPPELFQALRESEVRLRSWRWNNTFCDQGPLGMKSIHSDAAFQTLRELTLTKFHPAEVGEDRDKDEDFQGPPTTEELVASALAALPSLRALTFETCGIVSGRLLPLLPANLVSLSVINCGELLSDALQAFFTTHGAHLEELVLNHNQALDLSFLVDLKTSCPKLEVLRMDTTYYSSLSMSSDNEPLYETLLGESEKPTWPCTLRVVDMEYLRNWNSISATNFFSSLIEAADELPWLQEITIIAMVDTDWRQRAEFRRKWTDQFRKVFARAWKPPTPHLASMKAWREWQSGARPLDMDTDKNDMLAEGAPEVIDEAKLDHSDSDVPLIQSREEKQNEQWGSKRLRSRSKAAASYDESSDEELQSEATASTDDKVAFVQGRCHTVLFRIDNFRPREEIYGEADFLDAEPSGDEEWNGNDDQDDEGGYAW
ncbi:hypothetical protein BDU57DRAFT_514475 [Ampelomyces quisqualis]|uniref:Uncharacterized protein n=1 Tax=Ampelomyces quisqualis TaxID=50730 RepID=A0A6A5QTS5_AMPQU|nr:hypothetical protein BDU57DRAFT_514475 [Ampelomyces quisqualis]